MGQALVPDGLWEIVEPLLPAQRERPQGGGTRYVEDRAVFTAIVYVLTTGCAWRHLPAEFGVSKATAHRRFVAWTEAGLWRRLHRAVLDRLGAQKAIDWSRAVVDAASVRAKKMTCGGAPLAQRTVGASTVVELEEAPDADRRRIGHPPAADHLRLPR
jgi:transposase